MQNKKEFVKNSSMCLIEENPRANEIVVGLERMR
jgi:hypothetical protein